MEKVIVGRGKQVAGLIKKISNVFPSAVSIDFECPACGHIMNIPQGDNKRLPKICTNCGKSPKQWETVHEYIIDTQKVIIIPGVGIGKTRLRRKNGS